MANSLHCLVVVAAIFLSVQSSPSCTPKEVFGWCRNGFHSDCVKWVCDDEIKTTSMPKKSDNSWAKNIDKNPLLPPMQPPIKKWKSNDLKRRQKYSPLPVLAPDQKSIISSVRRSFSFSITTTRSSNQKKKITTTTASTVSVNNTFKTQAALTFSLTHLPLPRNAHKQTRNNTFSPLQMTPSSIKTAKAEAPTSRKELKNKRKKYYANQVRQILQRRHDRQRRSPPPSSSLIPKQFHTLHHRPPPRPVRPHHLLLQFDLTTAQSTTVAATTATLTTTTTTSTKAKPTKTAKITATSTSSITTTTQASSPTATMGVGTTTPATTTATTTTLSSLELSTPSQASEKRGTSLITTNKCQKASVIRWKNQNKKRRERMRLLRTRHHETRPMPTMTSQSDNVRETVSREKKVENVNVTVTAAVKNTLDMNMSFLANLSNVTLTVDCGDFLMVETYSEREVCFHYDRNKESMLKSHLF